MLNMTHYPSDNILSSISVSLTNNNYNQTDIEDSTANDMYILNYNNNTPSLADSTIYNIATTITNVDSMEVLPDSTAVIGLVMHDDDMEHYCNDLCNDDYKYKLDDFNFIISGNVNGE
jgi:hypothetical protein